MKINAEQINADASSITSIESLTNRIMQHCHELSFGQKNIRSSSGKYLGNSCIAVALDMRGIQMAICESNDATVCLNAVLYQLENPAPLSVGIKFDESQCAMKSPTHDLVCVFTTMVNGKPVGVFDGPMCEKRMRVLVEYVDAVRNGQTFDLSILLSHRKIQPYGEKYGAHGEQQVMTEYIHYLQNHIAELEKQYSERVQAN